MDEPLDRYARLRRVVPLLGILLAAGAIYDAGVFYSRWNSAQKAKQAQADAETNHAEKVIEQLGGDELKIVAFYAKPGAIARGARMELCYGVTGAKTVRIEPPVGAVWPALSRCLEASPQRDTEYKLVAEDGAGHSATETLPVKVR